LSYGGRDDISNAAVSFARETRRNDGELSSEGFAKHLSTYNLPDPDLLIRTGGEYRISNFMLWQLAYTELYFCDTLWPDFSEDDLNRAIDVYKQRERRYGR
jgi:undecaprenyl diphosphate synthase